MKRTITGQCRFCRCTEQKPCTLPSGEDCWWFDKDRTVCTKQQHMPKIVGGVEDFEACFDNWWLCRCEQPDGARMPVVMTGFSASRSGRPRASRNTANEWNVS